MHCFTLSERGVSRGIQVSRQIQEGKERAGIKAGEHFLLFHPEYSDRYLQWANKYKIANEVVTNLDFENNVIVPADANEKSDYALALVDVQPANGGRNEITASVKEEYFDHGGTGLVQRNYRNIGDAVGIRVFFPVIDTGNLDISYVMQAAAGGNAQLLENDERTARQECFRLLALWEGPYLLIMAPGSTFRVFRKGGTGNEPKAFSFRWVWSRGMRRPSMRWDVHEPKNYQHQERE